MPDRTVIVSDIHLGAISEENERAFLAFLESADRWGGDLLINGDLFDFWFEYRHVVPRGHLAPLARLRRLVESGMRVRFLGGNHDAWAGGFLEREVGMEILEGPLVTEVGGRRAYVAHGDGLGGADWGYRGLKWLTRSALGRGLFRWVHPDVGVPAARRASGTRRRAMAGAAAEGPRAASLAAHGRALLAERAELDLVVFGHTHRPELIEVDPGRFYLNAGDWIHHRSFAVVGPDEVRLETFEPGPAG